MSDDKISFSEDSSIIGSTGLQYLIPSNDVVFKNSQELLSVSPIGCDVRNSFSPNATSYDPWTQPFGGFLAGNSPVSTIPNNTHKLNSPSSNLTIPTILSPQPQAGSPFQVPSINHSNGLNSMIPPKAPTAPTVTPHVAPTSFDALSENLSKFTLGKSGHHTDGWIEDWLFGMGGMDGVEAQPMVGLLRRASNTTSTDNFNDPHQSRLKPYSLSPRISPIGSPDIILPTSQPIQSLHQQKQALQQPQQQLQQLQQQQLQLQQQIQQQQQQIQQQQQLQQQQLQQQQLQQRDQPQQQSQQREHGQSRGMRSRPQYQPTMSNHTSPSFNNSKQQRYTTSDPISSYSHSSHSHSHSAHQSPRDASKLSQYSQQFQQYQQYNNNNQPLHPHRNGQGNRDSPRSFESSYESSPRQNVKYFSSSNPALGERERTHSHSHSSQSSSFTQESSSFYGSSEEESGSYSMSQGDGSYSPNFKGNGNPNNKSNKYRGWSNSKKEYDLSRFELDVVKVLSGEEKRTTLMVKNIPNKYTQEMLLETISENHKGLYDFFYLPIDFKNKCNVGYSFINFIDPLSIPNFYMEFNQKRWSKFNSSKVCKITYARIQGKSAFIEHFRNSSLMNEEIKCRPLIFYGSGPQQGLPEPFPDPRAIMPNSSTSPSNSNITNSTGSIGSNISVRTNSTVGNLPTVEIHPASFDRDNRQANGNNNNGQSGNGMKMNGEIEVLSSRGDGELFNYRNAI